MLNIICCGYRSWANDIIDNVMLNPNIKCLDIIRDNETFLEKSKEFSDNIDFILFLGWSWIIEDDITDKYLCLGIHPSNLPMFRGGSPIQHQIIAGLTVSTLSLITLSSKLDAGDIWAKEMYSLEGNTMKTIFDNVAVASIRMLSRFFEEFKTITPIKQNTEIGSYYKRRTPGQSKVTFESLNSMKLVDVYNLCRSLTDPYPNLYVEDVDGNRLLFKELEYIPKNNI